MDAIHIFPCSKMIKKTFFYNFIPSKAEEDACRAANSPWQVSRLLVEARDVFPPPPPAAAAAADPWQIRKTLSHYEVITGKLVAPFADAFEHVFRYWTLCMANQAVLGHKTNVIIWDVTDQNNPKRYGAAFEILPSDDYTLACMDLFKDRAMGIEDEIGLYWDYKGSTFQFKLLRKANNNNK